MYDGINDEIEPIFQQNGREMKKMKEKKHCNHFSFAYHLRAFTALSVYCCVIWKKIAHESEKVEKMKKIT